MKLGSLNVDGDRRFGVVNGDQISLFDKGVDPKAVLENPGGFTASGERVAWRPSDGVDVPFPVAAVRDFITFEQHTAGSLRSVSGTTEVPDIWYEAPAFYFTNPHASIGSGVDVTMPPGSNALDFELEVAAVIGKAGYNLSVEEAASHIVGLTIMNDWSARDLQSREMKVGLGPAKGKDTATTLGPVLVTMDELAAYQKGDRYDLGMQVWVNDTEIGSDTLANMAWSFAELIAYASRGTWVRPGDVIGSGTCGSGCLAEFWGWNGEQSPPPIQVGDTVRMSVEGIGEISNTVIAGPITQPVPPAKRGTVTPPLGIKM